MMTDEQLAVRAREGDELAMRALIGRFATMTRALARAVYTPGQDQDDLDQEAAIALYAAARDWRPEHGIPFGSFAALVVKRRLITVVITARRVKHDVLSFAVRRTENDEGDVVDALDLIPARDGDPAKLLSDRADLQAIADVVKYDLSELERTVLLAISDGESHVALQERLGMPFTRWPDGRRRAKSVENAWQRAQMKLRRAVEADAVPLGVAA